MRTDTNTLLFNAVVKSERAARSAKNSLATKVERLASLNAQIKAREQEASEIKAELLSCGMDYIEGSAHAATIVHSIRTTLDPERVRALITPAAYASCEKTAAVHSVRISDL